MSASVCRVCFCGDVIMHSIEGKKLTEVFETMSGSKLHTEDLRPTSVCYICVSQLQRCRRLFRRARETERTLTYLHNNRMEIPGNDVTVLALAATHNLSVTALPHLDVIDYSTKMSHRVKVEIEQVAVKQETADDEHPDNFEETALDDVDVDGCQDSGQGLQDNACSESQYFYCDVCNEKHSSKPSLIRHLRSHTGTMPHTPNSCNKNINQTEYNHNKCIPTVKKPHVCNKCNRTFSTAGSLKRHMRIHTGEKPHVCNECNRAFSTAGNLKAHVRVHTGEKPYVCNECNRAFSTAGNLKAHVRVHTGEKPYVCNQCNNAFNQPGTLKQHMLTHNKEKPYVCTQCNAAFRRMSYLKAHLKIHAEPCVCKQCNRAFSLPAILKRHMRIHSGEKPYVCKQCNRALSLPAALKRHMRIHTGEKPYVCNQCNNAFRQHGALNRHMLTHTKEKPYVCSQCNSAFRKTSCFKKHMKIHTGE